MNNISTIYSDKTLIRVYFIVEWAQKRGLKQADIVRETGADKGLVSRWFSGTLPKPEYLENLRQVFELDDISALFRHPDDDWIARFFHDKTEEQKERAIEMLKLMFQQTKTGTDG